MTLASGFSVDSHREREKFAIDSLTPAPRRSQLIPAQAGNEYQRLQMSRHRSGIPASTTRSSMHSTYSVLAAKHKLTV